MRTAVQTLKRAVASSSSSSSLRTQRETIGGGVIAPWCWRRSNFPSTTTTTADETRRFIFSSSRGMQKDDGDAPLPSPLQRAPMKTPPSDEQKDLTDQLGNLKIHSSVSEDGEKSSSSSGGQEVFYAVKKNAKGSTKRFQAFMKILRGGLTVEEALIQCKLSPKKKVANELYQIINSAKFNAIVGLGREPEDGYVDANCVISKATATKGQYLKRIYVKAKGMAGTMHRARTHIRIEVQEQDARKRMRVFDPNDEERAKIGQEGKTPFEPPWITRRKQGEKRYRFAKEAGIL